MAASLGWVAMLVSWFACLCSVTYALGTGQIASRRVVRRFAPELARCPTRELPLARSPSRLRFWALVDTWGPCRGQAGPEAGASVNRHYGTIVAKPRALSNRICSAA